jgi:hypothetical protein
MRKVLSSLLVTLIIVVGLTFTGDIPSAAPEKSAAFTAYQRWRSKVLSRRSDDAEPPHFSLAVSTERIDAESARMEFVIVGQRSDFTLKLQPVKLKTGSDGQLIKEAIGEATEIRRSPTVSGRSQFLTLTTDFSVQITVDKSANAIEVRGGDGSGMMKIFRSLLLPLRSTISANVVGTVFRPSKSNLSAFKKAAFGMNVQNPPPCPGYNPPTNTCDPPGAGECVNLTVVCDSGQVIGVCCLGGAADIDTANCTITCQFRRCTPRECQLP